MDKVWVVSIGAYSERRIAGVFSTKDKAEETAEDLKMTRPQEPVFVRDYPFDVQLSQLCDYELECADGEWREISRHEVREEYFDHALKDRFGTYAVIARTFEEAVERAKKLEEEQAEE